MMHSPIDKLAPVDYSVNMKQVDTNLNWYERYGSLLHFLVPLGLLFAVGAIAVFIR